MRRRLTARLRRHALALCRRGDDESGAILVLWVSALVAVMGCAAMAVDLGNVAQTKEHAETAVQDAVLAAVPQLATLYVGGSGSASAQEQAAVNVAETYLVDNYAAVAGDFGPSACAGLLPATVSLWPGSDCFGFFNPADPALDTSNPSAMAVALPTRLVNYSLGRAAGLVHQPVSAVAYASLERGIGASGGFPFGYVAGGGVGLECLKTGSGESVAGCTGFATGSGSFGTINSPRYRVFPGTASGGGNNAVIGTDLALGIDHTLNAFGAPPAGSTSYCDATSSSKCSGAAGASPSTYDWANYVVPQTGQTLTDLAGGLFTGQVTPDRSCTLEPLLAHPDGFVPSNSCTADNPTSGPSGPYLSSGDTFGSTYTLNGRHISDYLNSAGEADTAGCNADLPAGVSAATTAIDATAGGSSVWAGYDGCLAGIMTGFAATPETTVPPNDAIFSSAIEASPRFGQVPIVEPSNGKNPEEIVGFADAYLDMAFAKGGKVGAVLAWIFPPSMVADTVSSSAGAPGYTGGSYVPFLCSYGVSPC